MKIILVGMKKVERSMETLKNLKPGEECYVTNVTGEGAVRRRLFDMGITPGAHIILRKTAPLGDPLELTIRGYQLSIRKAEAKEIVIKRV